MFPRQIAAEIQMKKRSNAEQLESVTIFYSDIQDFTAIVHDSSPMEVL